MTLTGRGGLTMGRKIASLSPAVRNDINGAVKSAARVIEVARFLTPHFRLGDGVGQEVKEMVYGE
jgi:hypothetical protein